MSHFDQNGKGSRRRGDAEARKRYEKNYERIFGKKATKPQPKPESKSG